RSSPARRMVAWVLMNLLREAAAPAGAGAGGPTPRLLGISARSIRSERGARELAERGLESGDDAEFHRAELAARALGRDTFPHLWRRLQADPLGFGWWAVMRGAGDGRIDEVLAFAETALPLDEVATGPAMSLGVGPGWAPHRAL